MEFNKKVALKNKVNMKLYPMYRLFAIDVLFYNAIKVLFLTQVKGISNAEVVLMETIYAFFKLTLQIPLTVLVSKLGIRKSTILGNIFWTLELVLILFSSNYFIIILSQLMSAIGWSYKSIAEEPLLDSSIPQSSKKGKIFTKIDSKGYSRYCYISAISTIMSGFLYDINPYIPIILTIIFMAFALILSTGFIELPEEKIQDKKTIKQSLEDVKDGFKFIFKSPRLKSLLLMLGFMWGTFCLFGTYQSTLLKDINVSATYIGIILAVLDIFQGLAATKADNFNEKHKNKSLICLCLQNTLTTAIAGGVVILGIARIPQLAIIIICYIISKYDKGIYQVLKKRYIGNFMTSEMLTKIYSIYSTISSIFRMIIGAIGSYLLTIMNIQYAMVAIGIILAIVGLIFSIYMKTRIGLKPEEYTEKDVIYMN